MELRTWLREALKRTGKSQAALARHLGFRHPSQVTAILKGERRIQVDELQLIASFLGEDPPSLSRTAPTVHTRAESPAGAPVEGVAMEGMWREGPAKTLIKRVTAVMGSDYPIEIQYALQIDDPERSPDIASEHVLCVPVAKIQRPLRKNDLLHCERTKIGLTQTVLRRVVSGAGKTLRVAQRDGRGATEALSDYEVKGLVIGRTERFND
jgi:transcriptional regulator with XRE-family HTH domain